MGTISIDKTIIRKMIDSFFEATLLPDFEEFAEDGKAGVQLFSVFELGIAELVL